MRVIAPSPAILRSSFVVHHHHHHQYHSSSSLFLRRLTAFLVSPGPQTTTITSISTRTSVAGSTGRAIPSTTFLLLSSFSSPTGSSSSASDSALDAHHFRFSTTATPTTSSSTATKETATKQEEKEKETAALTNHTQSKRNPMNRTMMMTPQKRIAKLRARMAEHQLDVYIVPSDDPHLSEYVPDAYKRRAFLSGFHGSAGTAVVTATDAYLWTDSRYWQEATLQLDPTIWTLHKVGLTGSNSLTLPQWLGEYATRHYTEQTPQQQEQQRIPKPLVVGIDPFVHAASFAKEVMDAFQESAKNCCASTTTATTTTTGVLETSLPHNLVDEVWGKDRPAVPTQPFRVHPLSYAGVCVADKVAAVRTQMTEKNVTLSVFTALDEVAYLLNVRCQGDIETCPVGIAYAAVTHDHVFLYCDPAKVTGQVVNHHHNNHLNDNDENKDMSILEHLRDVVTIRAYDQIVEDIQAHCESSSRNKVWMDKARTNYGLVRLIPSDHQLLDAKTAVTDAKAAKNQAELHGMRLAHIMDGVAMAKFMSWLQHQIVQVGRKVSEVEIDRVLTNYRAEHPDFVEVSFPTIAGVGPNGAIIHYRATENEIMRYLDIEQPILIDSGGQYLFGTTDVTRSWHFGNATPEYRDAYTRVLKGHIGLDEMIFPEDTPGFALDIYARRWLWDAGKDYGHGTGHGVGAALNVHEGPMSISPRWNNKEGLKQGMVVSNEPGYYEEGNFGIRIENLLEIQYVDPDDNTDQSNQKEEVKSKMSSTKKKFLRFQKLTMIPIQKNLIDLSLMTSRELDWLDAYHANVFETVSPLLEPYSDALAWLTKSCEKINRS